VTIFFKGTAFTGGESFGLQPNECPQERHHHDEAHDHESDGQNDHYADHF